MNCKTIFSLVVLVISLLFGIIVYRTRSYIGPSGYGFPSTAEEIAKDIDLTGKVAMVTGASSGLGEETSRILAKQGAHVFVLSRSLSKSQQAVENILANLPPSPPKPYKLTPLSCDMGSLNSIKKAVEDFKSLSIPLHILVTNAAFIPYERTFTEDGFESQWGINHLGHFYLVNLLMDKLIESQPSRVVVVASESYQLSTTSFNESDLGQNKEYDYLNFYSSTKLANILHARELSERFASKGVTAYSLHPGEIPHISQGWLFERDNPDLWVIPTPSAQKISLFVSIIVFMVTPVAKSVAQGAATIVYAALKATESGKYFLDCNLNEIEGYYGKLIDDPEVRKNLWETSEKLIQEKLEKNVHTGNSESQ